jgi:hypothetical protein
MPLDPIRQFVKTKGFRLHIGIAGILHRLRVNDHQRCPLGFFLPVPALVHVIPIHYEIALNVASRR